ncbi:death domain-associated protein (plasmid) [Natronorubrum bangense]|uniref:Death domain-associated protein n=1 Tax=Natronorubrum bangense TaxID=61858 RepID=A0A4D6HVC3_9EURY|nr:death domain-associated protein [Natronorubrum bangense]
MHGFGSYDESEQQQQNVSDEDDEDAAVNVHENDYEGEMTVETGDSTDNLIGQLQEIKENKESEEE